MIRYSLPIILSSSEASGALSKSPDGSSFQINLERGILVPKEAVYSYLVCQSAEIWNTSPNILTGINDKLYLSDGLGALVITIPQGLYDRSLLNEEIDRQIVASGRPTNSIVLLGNDATQKIILEIAASGTSIDFTQSDTFRDILGFNSQIINTVVADTLVTADNVAAFNVIDYYLLHADLVSKGLQVNGKYSQIVSQVLIEAPTGSQIKYEPQNIPEIPCNELIGNKINTINVWLTDQDNQRVDTAGEDYSMRLVIHYFVPNY